MKSIHMMEVNQPIGTFYIGKMLSRDIISISKVSHRSESKGHQRQLKNERAKEISVYCTDPDATFPTPIILAVSEGDFVCKKEGLDGFVTFQYDENRKCAEILDGQHRIAGIAASNGTDFELPIVVMFNLREEQKAYVFSTINGNQVKVDKSLIYDLFDLSLTRSPYKTCHYLARGMNSDPKSPFYKRLKMLEKRQSSGETISQNTFVKNICALISNKPKEDGIAIKRKEKLRDNPKLVFRKYFISENDQIILKILYNYFSAARSVFPEEWDNPKSYILTKTVGFEGLVLALPELIIWGEEKRDLSVGYFIRVFNDLKAELNKNHMELVAQDFPSNSAGASNLARLILSSIQIEA